MVTGGGGPGEAKALFVLGMLHALQRSAQARNAFLLKKLLGVA